MCEWRSARITCMRVWVHCSCLEKSRALKEGRMCSDVHAYAHYFRVYIGVCERFRSPIHVRELFFNTRINTYRIANQRIRWALPALEAPSIFMITRHAVKKSTAFCENEKLHYISPFLLWNPACRKRTLAVVYCTLCVCCGPLCV